MRIQRITSELQVKEAQQKIDLSLIQFLIDKYKDKKGNLIPILQGTQNIYGYVPKEAFEKIAQETNNALSDMYGVATFYSQFRLHPVGKHIVKVCHGTACHVQSAPALTAALEDVLGIKDGETTEDMMFTLESVACLGCCSLAPVMMIGDETYGKLDGKKASKVIKEIKRTEKTNN
jgi:NADH-quinone oxidoreductase subunit E